MDLGMCKERLLGWRKASAGLAEERWEAFVVLLFTTSSDKIK